MAYPILHNGQWFKPEEIRLSIQDLGFLRGYGVFDYFRVVQGRPIFLRDHLHRFLHSSQAMGMTCPYDLPALEAMVQAILPTLDQALLGIKIILSGGKSTNGFVPQEKPQLWMIPGDFSFAAFEQGLRLMTIPYQREMPEIKSLNYAFALRHWAEMQEKGFGDLLYHHPSFGVSECSRSNLFLVKNGVLMTPARGVLEGITRKKILDLAPSLLPLKVQDLQLKDFLEADEVFTTGTTKRVLPILGIDNHSYGIGPVTKMLYKELLTLESKA